MAQQEIKDPELASLDTNKRLTKFEDDSRKFYKSQAQQLSNILSKIQGIQATGSNIPATSTSTSTTEHIPPTDEKEHIPPATSKEDNDTKSFLSKIWNKVEAKEAFNKTDYNGKKLPFIGALTDGLVVGLTKSVIMESPWAKAVKFLLSTPGILLMFFVYKLFMKYVWNGPIGTWIKTTLGWVENFWNATKEFRDWITSNLPTMKQIGEAFGALYKDITNADKFWDKVGNFLLDSGQIINILLGPITNPIREFVISLLKMTATLLDKLFLKTEAASLLNSAQTLMSGMVGSEEHTQELKKAFEESEIVKKYANPDKSRKQAKANTAMKQPLDDSSQDYLLTAEQRMARDLLRSKKRAQDESGMERDSMGVTLYDSKYRLSSKDFQAINKNAAWDFGQRSWDAARQAIRDIRSSDKLKIEDVNIQLSKLLDPDGPYARSPEGMIALLNVIQENSNKILGAHDRLDKQLQIINEQALGTQVIINNQLNEATDNLDNLNNVPLH